MRGTAERLLERAQQAGAVRDDLTPSDVMMLVHGVVVATERTPEQADRLLSLTLDGLRTRPNSTPAPPPAPVWGEFPAYAGNSPQTRPTTSGAALEAGGGSRTGC